MHVFFRSDADRLAIRPVGAPWSDNRGNGTSGSSDLNSGENISHLIFWQGDDIALGSSFAESEEISRPRASNSGSDAHSASSPLRHVESLGPKGQAKRPVTPLLRLELPHNPTRNNSFHTFFPTSASAASLMSSSMTSNIIDDDIDLPLLPPTVFVRNHNRSVSTGSSLTVQFGLRISYTNHALDHIEASSASIIRLHIAL